jgi:hypothetical protein
MAASETSSLQPFIEKAISKGDYELASDLAEQEIVNTAIEARRQRLNTELAMYTDPNHWFYHGPLRPADLDCIDKRQLEFFE